MKALILPLVFLLAAATLLLGDSEESYHTFEDEQGRTVRAVLIRTSPKAAWIRREDGKTFRVERSTFSETDQKYISQWRQANALKDPNAFKFSVRRYSDGRESRSSISTKTKIEKFGYIISITNNTAIDLEDLDVEYRYYSRRGSLDATGQDRPLERHAGRTRIPVLPSREKEEFKTGSISLTSTSLKANWHYSDSNRHRTSDDLGGVWLRIKQDGKLIAEYSSPSSLKEKEHW